MKNPGNLFIIIIAIQALTACEDALDKFPKDRTYPEDYFRTETELQLYTNQFYTYLPEASAVYDEASDLIAKQQLPAVVTGLRDIPATGGGWSWSQLRVINECIVGLKNCSDEKLREKYEGIARFFRAYFYFEKVKRFGDVPWYDHPIGSADKDLYKPRDSRELVMTKIIEDLDFAAAHLGTAREVYKIGKWTALALKSRVCLFEGTFRKYHGITYPEHDYRYYLTQAAEAADNFIADSGYRLYTSTPATAYRDLFAGLNARPEEVILARDYNGAIGLTHSVNFFLSSTSFGRPSLTKKIVNTYLTVTGGRFTDLQGYETKNFKDECTNRDPRLAQTIRTPGYTRIGETTSLAPNLAFTITGYQLTKWMMGAAYDVINTSCNDIILFRAAEVYLNFAEAKAELGTLTQADINRSVKLIRDRVGMPNLDVAAANAAPDPYLESPATGYPNAEAGAYRGVILEIRRERSIELISEGFRYYDLVRWKEGKAMEQAMYGIYVPAMGDYDLDGYGGVDVCFYRGTKPATSAAVSLEIEKDMFLSNGQNGYMDPHQNTPRNWNETRDYLYPLPIEDRLLTNGALTQNPGWDDGLSF
ncbi:MAG: RagB/SusD family nutrient uptake outer membrane protein [Dysgonamonadaceae bacterium]|nr:RagB/SusD family nutrient uptake outer membrane protein [Dysgonamonadaceae bacterium]